MTALRTAPLALLLLISFAAPAQANQMLGRVVAFTFDFCPLGWTPADGRELSISQNAPLYSLLGTIYGGDGRTTFAMPDLRGRTPIGWRYGDNQPGHSGGLAFQTLTTSDMVRHVHSFSGSSAAPNSRSPALAQFGSYPAAASAYATGPVTLEMHTQSIGSTGQTAPFDIRQPFLVMTWCIATQGYLPRRS